MRVKPGQNPWILDPKRKQAIVDQKALIVAMHNKAQACLEDPKFVEYKALILQYQADTIEHIIMVSEQDPIKYAFKIRQLVDTLKAYRLLVTAVEDDAQRKVD